MSMLTICRGEQVAQFEVADIRHRSRFEQHVELGQGSQPDVDPDADVNDPPDDVRSRCWRR